MIDNSIAIVTAFFSIGRERWTGFNKSDNTYLNYFKSWASLKNDLFVFVESDYLKKEVLEFRSNNGLKDKTFVTVVNNIESIAPDLLSNISNCTSNELSVAYRYSPTNPECIKPLYNYVMLLKAWCIEQAALISSKHSHYAWIDFGFNHGGEVYSLDSDFNFLWEYQFSDKITLFNLKQLDNRPIFDIIFSMDTYIMGSMIIVPKELTGKFWPLAKDMMKSLTMCGLTDDDQVVWLMCLRNYDDLFVAYPTTAWHRALYEYGGEHHLKVVEVGKQSLLKEKFRSYKRNLDCLKYASKVFKISKEWTQM